MVFYIVGILLLVAEVFLPTFGIVGILGIVCVIGGIAMTAHDVQSAVLSALIVLLIVALAVAVAAKVLGRRGFWNKFILKERLTAEQGFVSQTSKDHLIGREGKALTPLRPAGTAEIGGERVDVVTSGEFVAQGSRLSVLHVEGTRVVVKQIDQ